MRAGLGHDLLDGSASFSTVVEEAQRALPPVGLVLDPSNCTVTAGGDTFELKPSKFALYWLLARRVLRGRPAAHWSEADFMTQLLDYYGRIELTGPGEYDRIETAYEGGRGDKIVNPRQGAHQQNSAAAPRRKTRRAVPDRSTGADPHYAAQTIRTPASLRTQSGFVALRTENVVPPM